MADIKPITPQERALLDYIGKFESKGGDYNILYGHYKDTPEKKPTDMTIREILALQEKMIDYDYGKDKNGKKIRASSPIGAHQIISTTLKDEIKKEGWSLDEKFTPDMQDRIILTRLNRMRGFDKFLSGEKSTEDFALALAKEFASLPNPGTGTTYYGDPEGTVANKSLTSVDDVFKNLESIKDMPTFPDWDEEVSGQIASSETNTPIKDNRIADTTDPVVDNPMDQWADPSREGRDSIDEFADTNQDKEEYNNPGPSGDVQFAQKGERAYNNPITGGTDRNINALAAQGAAELPKHIIDNTPMIASAKAKAKPEPGDADYRGSLSRDFERKEGVEYLTSASDGINSRLMQHTRAGYSNKHANGGLLSPPAKIKGEGTIAYYKKLNKYSEGGILRGAGGPGPGVPGTPTTSTTTGPTQVNRSITATTGANGLPSSTRTTTRTTPTNTRTETPYTQAGNDAYANLDQSGRDAQDKAWSQIQNKNSQNASTETEEATQLGMKPLGIDFKPAGLRTGPSEAIQQVPVTPTRAPLYHTGGSNMHNMRFAGKEQTMITDDPNAVPDASFTTNPGDISTNSPVSGRDNIAYRNQLTTLQQDAAETPYGKSWNTVIPDDIANQMLDKQSSKEAKLRERATSAHHRQLAAKERTMANREANTNRRNQNQNYFGGSINSNEDPNSGLVEFEGGGTHEQNSLGGIPQGMGANGKLNTVEAEETKYKFKDGDYVFSNRIKI